MEFERLPKPIVTDLDGDGENEILTATRDPALQVWKYTTRPEVAPSEVRRKRPANLKMMSEVTLLSRVRVGTGRMPVAMATGYLRAYNATEENRKQVVVVVLDGWTVMCFDHTLKLMWESVAATDDVPDEFYIREASILITSHGVNKGDLGTVIVGGRLDTEDIMMTVIGHEHVNEVVEATKISHAGEEGVGDFDAELAARRWRHFSYYAFEGRTGKRRWVHEAQDFSSGGHDDGMLPDHTRAIEMAKLSHYGEVNWRQYRDSMIASLPHRWENKEDTSMSLAHFEKSRANRNKREPTSPEYEHHVEAAGFEELHIPGLSLAGLGLKAHSEEDHIVQPNVIVTHMEHGVEVLHLFSGKTLCQLMLDEGTYVDISGDKVIEHLEAISGRRFDRNGLPIYGQVAGMPQCYATATVGIPAAEQAWNGSICHSGGPVDSFDIPGYGENAASDADVHVLAPLVLLHKHSEMFKSHLHMYDSVFFVSNGRLTSYNPQGRLNWQIPTGARWSIDEAELQERESMTLDLLKTAAMPIFSVAALHEDGEMFIFVSGFHNLEVYSADGTLQGDVALPDVPVSPLVLGDFDSDGWSDLIITTRSGVHGLKVRHHLRSLLLPVVVCCLLLLLVYLFLRHRMQMRSTSQYVSRRLVD